MKKYFLLLCCIILSACDNSTTTGKCTPIKTTDTTTEFVCGCFTGESDTPFMIPQERFLFQINQPSANTDAGCDKECSDFCNGFTPDYVLGNW